MLNRHSKKFLNFLLKSSPDYADRVYTYTFIENNFNEPIESVFATVRYLEKLGYLEIATTSHSGTHFGVVLTETALHYKEFSRILVKEFFFKSIFTPILVSAVTTLLTLYIKSLLL